VGRYLVDPSPWEWCKAATMKHSKTCVLWVCLFSQSLDCILKRILMKMRMMGLMTSKALRVLWNDSLCFGAALFQQWGCELAMSALPCSGPPNGKIQTGGIKWTINQVDKKNATVAAVTLDAILKRPWYHLPCIACATVTDAALHHPLREELHQRRCCLHADVSRTHVQRTKTGRNLAHHSTRNRMRPSCLSGTPRASQSSWKRTCGELFALAHH